MIVLRVNCPSIAQTHLKELIVVASVVTKVEETGEFCGASSNMRLSRLSAFI